MVSAVVLSIRIPNQTTPPITGLPDHEQSSCFMNFSALAWTFHELLFFMNFS